MIPQTYDGSPRALEELSNNVLKSGQIGRLVANNFKSSIVDVPLLEMYPNPKNQSELIKLDYRQFSHELEEKIRDKYQLQNPNVKVHRRLREEGRRSDRRAGDGGRLLRYLPADHPGPAVLVHQCIRSTIAVLITTLVAVLWQLGLLNLVGFGLDPYSMLVPFLIFAIGISPRRAEDQWHRLAVQRRRQALMAARRPSATVPAGDDRGSSPTPSASSPCW